LVQQNPVHVRISLPEEHALLRGTSGLQEVVLQDATGSREDTPGKITFTDSRLDVRTGTLTLRAVFDNQEGTLIPGRFVRIQVPLQVYPEAILIPTLAVGEGPEGPQVFVLTDEQTVKSRPVRLGPVVEDQQLILDGLESGEKIVVNGLVTLFDGASVRVPDNAEGGN
jgi:membrane fusion protein (multidrug efflux system)